MFGFFLKTLLLVIIIILIRGTLPRYRIDHLIALSWKNVIFFYLGYLFLFICVLHFFPSIGPLYQLGAPMNLNSPF